MYTQEFFLLDFADFCLCLYAQEFFLLDFADLSLILVLQYSMGFKLSLPWSRDHQTSHCISVYIFFSCYKLFNTKFLVFALNMVHGVYKHNLIVPVKHAHYKGQALLLSHLIGQAGPCMDKMCPS